MLPAGREILRRFAERLRGTKAPLTTRSVPPSRAADWDALLGKHPTSRCIVPALEEAAGWNNHPIGLFRSGQLVGGLTLGVRRVPHLPVRLSRITALLLDAEDPIQSLGVLLDAVERHAMRRLVAETDLRVRIPATRHFEDYPDPSAVQALLRRRGYRPLRKRESTYIVRIDRDDKALVGTFEGMHQRKLRKAQRENIQVVERHDEAALHELWDALEAMRERKDLTVLPRDQVIPRLSALLRKGHATLFVEQYAGVAANLVLVDALGIPLYSFGARAAAHVAGQVPGSGQALHFEIMRRLRDRGRRYYDLGGCEGPNPIEGHPNFGVWRFKHRFCGEYVEFIPFYRRTRLGLRRLIDPLHRRRGEYT